MVKALDPILFARGETSTVPITFVTAADWPHIRERLDQRQRAFADAAGFEPRAGRHVLVPGPDGALAGILFGLEAADDRYKDMFRPGVLPGLLPAGRYRFANAPHDARLAALAFALGSYRFTRYRKGDDKDVRLELPDGVDGGELTAVAEGVTLARDLINTPANDMGPPDSNSPPARWPLSMAPASVRSSATISSRRTSRSSTRSGARPIARRGSSTSPGVTRLIRK